MATNLSGKERSKKIKGIVGPSQEASWLKSTYSEKKPVLEMPANILTSFDQDDKRTLAPELQMSIVPKDLCFHELESVVKIKQVEAKMFQSHADDARREAEGLNIWKICSKKTEENSDAAWRKHRSSHLSSPFLNVQPPPLLQLRRNVALVRRASASFLAKLLQLACLESLDISCSKVANFGISFLKAINQSGTSSTVNYDKILANAVTKTNILVVEGYLFELPDTIRAITEVCQKARSNGALVAVTASDVSCIERHYDDFWEIIGNHADLIFANSDEARALCNFDAKESSPSVTRYLSHFVPLVSVTDGHRGSYIGLKGEAVYIPPFPCVPVDTCGAGDAYACGILYGVLRGISDLKSIGSIAAKVAATVVGQQGTRLRVSDAVKLAESFTFHRSTIGSDIGTDHISSV
nr:uncharacterized protein LOC112778834 [Arachis hypogaea]